MNSEREFDVVTGAFGYTGRYITRSLLRAGRRVRTITNHANRENSLAPQVEIAPMNFGDIPGLARSLRGASTLYNTYWVRFNHGRATFDEAVANSRALIEAARRAGVYRIVHLSIANPSLESHLAYYAGKAQVEKAVIDSGLSYAILRPTVIFGPEDILINNIAWFTRRFPVFAIPGDGRYGIQPIFVEDVAALAVSEGRNAKNCIFDAVGPEAFTFEDLVRRIADAVGSRTRIFHLGARATIRALQVVGAFVGDVVLTPQEVEALEANLLVARGEPTGRTRFTEWLAANAQALGSAYSSELQRHYR